MLYDAGQFGAPSAGVRTISEFLWHRGYTRLDAVVLSHPDMDHFNALPGLLEKFSVGEVCVSPVMFEKDNHAVKVLHSAIEEHGVPVHEVRAGDRLRAGQGCAVEVLHPPRHGVLGSDNANSIVLAVDYQGREVLLPGDLESPGLDDVLAEEPRHCDVLLAPHHGSRQSNVPAPGEMVYAGLRGHQRRWTLESARDRRHVSSGRQSSIAHLRRRGDSGADRPGWSSRIPVCRTTTTETEMTLTAVLTPAPEGGFVAFNPETGTTSQGETLPEALAG